MPAITPALQARAAARLTPRDRAIFAMRLADTPASDIATTVGLDGHALAARVDAIVATLGAGEGAGDGAGAGTGHPELGGAPALPARRRAVVA
jgi:hypothetical protein